MAQVSIEFRIPNETPSVMGSNPRGPVVEPAVQKQYKKALKEDQPAPCSDGSGILEGHSSEGQYLVEQVF
jgi:hypothetical protein